MFSLPKDTNDTLERMHSSVRWQHLKRPKMEKAEDSKDMVPKMKFNPKTDEHEPVTEQLVRCQVIDKFKGEVYAEAYSYDEQSALDEAMKIAVLRGAPKTPAEAAQENAGLKERLARVEAEALAAKEQAGLEAAKENEELKRRIAELEAKTAKKESVDKPVEPKAQKQK